MSGIVARFRATQGAFALDAELEAPLQGVTGLFGPSGAGKSTLLRCIAGLMRAEGGYCAIGDDIWQDDTRGVFVPVHKRGVGYMFQEPSLFPHLTVRKNILYGFGRTVGRKRTIQFRDAVEWTGIAPILERTPGGLSGGERQRVAIARALLSNPRLLLMDEPVSSIDEAGRAEILPCLDRLHRELAVPVILVSHSLREIARVADTLALMEAGRVTKTGALRDVLPTICAAGQDGGDPFSVIDAPVFDHEEGYHLTRLQTPFGPIWAGHIDAELGAIARVQIAARDVSIGLAYDEQSSIVNQFPARIAGTAEHPPGSVLVRLIPPESEPQFIAAPILSLITRRSWEHLRLAVGQTVYARVKGVSVLR